MLKYPDNILPTIALFFQHKNDIDIFIEDENDEEFYKVLLSRLKGKKIKIDKVISLNGKQKVIDACRNDQTDRKRKRIYLVDGDLDLIFDNNTKLSNLFILDRYCIENYLFEEEAMLEILHDELMVDKKRIKQVLSFSNWLKGISNPLIDLFLHYSINHELQNGKKTTSNSVGCLCKQKGNVTDLDLQKVNEKIEKMAEDLKNEISEEKYQEIIYSRREKWTSNTDTLIRIVSGKDYLLPLLFFRFAKFKTLGTISLTKEKLRFRLAKTCKLTSLNRLKIEINK